MYGRMINLCNLIVWLLNSDYDCPIGLTGREGVGKSSTAIQLASRVDKHFNLKDNIAYTIKEVFEKKTNPFRILYKGFPIWLGLRQWVYVQLVHMLDPRVELDFRQISKSISN